MRSRTARCSRPPGSMHRSRQLMNVLYDPLAAFANWHCWLKPAGVVLVIDGLYERAAWSGTWAEEVDVLPVAACQSTALVPYLLEQSGFSVEAVRMMDAVNRRPSTRTRVTSSGPQARLGESQGSAQALPALSSPSCSSFARRNSFQSRNLPGRPVSHLPPLPPVRGA